MQRYGLSQELIHGIISAGELIKDLPYYALFQGATIVVGLCVMAFLHPTTIVIISGLLLINVLGGLCFMALVATSHEITKK
jgi:hypothetical protein